MKEFKKQQSLKLETITINSFSTVLKVNKMDTVKGGNDVTGGGTLDTDCYCPKDWTELNWC